MLARTHLLCAAPVAIFTPLYFDNPLYVGVISVGLLMGALFPDIDEEGSYISRRFRFLYWCVALLRYVLMGLFLVFIIFNKAFWDRAYEILSHRGITHMLAFPLLFFATSMYLPTFYGLFIFSFGVGWLIHELGDMTTHGGIKNWLFPFFIGKIFWVSPRFLRYRTGKMPEPILMFFLVLSNGYLALYVVLKHINLPLYELIKSFNGVLL